VHRAESWAECVHIRQRTGAYLSLQLTGDGQKCWRAKKILRVGRAAPYQCPMCDTWALLQPFMGVHLTIVNLARWIDWNPSNSAWCFLKGL
jgi:hypothetical protein